MKILFIRYSKYEKIFLISKREYTVNIYEAPYYKSVSLLFSYYYYYYSACIRLTNHIIIFLLIRMSNAKIIYLKIFAWDILPRSGVENSI